MRALRVVGLGEDGTYVVCEDSRGERFKVPADEQLRAASRGDVTRLGQIEIELESQMRPREIQARIRAGESVEHVAHVAAIPMQRVERYAYPVLLERSRTAELAQQAHPIREDGPDVQTLSEIAAYAFGTWGQDFGAVSWDSWRGEDGRWVVQLAWQAGRSENRAHWAFSPGAHGGTVTPLDEAAQHVMDPQSVSLRTVSAPAAEPEVSEPEMPEEPEVLATDDPILQPPVELVGRSSAPMAPSEPVDGSEPGEQAAAAQAGSAPGSRSQVSARSQAQSAQAQSAQAQSAQAQRSPGPSRSQVQRPQAPSRSSVASRQADVQSQSASRQADVQSQSASRQADVQSEPASRQAEARTQTRPQYRTERARPEMPSEQAARSAAAGPESRRGTGRVDSRPDTRSAQADASERRAEASSRPAPEARTGTESGRGQDVEAARPQPDSRRPDTTADTSRPAAQPDSAEPTAQESPAKPTQPAKPAAQKPPAKRGKKGRPAVPSWEDVLLGVRSNR